MYPNVVSCLALRRIGLDGDEAYIRLHARSVYVAAILDALSGKVVGSGVGNALETRLTVVALDTALRERH